MTGVMPTAMTNFITYEVIAIWTMKSQGFSPR